MISRQAFECPICKSVTVTRTQAGYINSYPVYLYCGGCMTVYSGNVNLYPEAAQIRVDLNNTVPCNERYPHYEIELSAELLTNKLLKKEQFQITGGFSPFMRISSIIREEGLRSFMRSILGFVEKKNKDWSNIKKINNLWFNERYEFIENEVKEYLPKDKFPTDNEIEYLRSIHVLNLLFFGPILQDDYYQNTANHLLVNIPELLLTW